MKYKQLTKKFLKQKYIIENLSSYKIADMVGCDRSVITRYLQKFNIVKNDYFKTKNEKEFLEKRIGLLIVKRVIRKQNKIKFICICDCGNETEVFKSNLTRNHTTSCGCMQKQVVSIKNYSGGEFISGRRFYQFKRGAKNRNISFEITVEDVDNLYKRQKGICALSGVPIKFDSREINGDQNKCGQYRIIVGNASIDRIDSTKGYTIDNIQLVDKIVNIAKQSETNKDFIRMCKNVAKYNKD